MTQRHHPDTLSIGSVWIEGIRLIWKCIRRKSLITCKHSTTHPFIFYHGCPNHTDDADGIQLQIYASPNARELDRKAVTVFDCFASNRTNTSQGIATMIPTSSEPVVVVVPTASGTGGKTQHINLHYILSYGSRTLCAISMRGGHSGGEVCVHVCGGKRAHKMLGSRIQNRRVVLSECLMWYICEFELQKQACETINNTRCQIRNLMVSRLSVRRKKC